MKISVVIATYNGAAYLEAQIASVLNQTLPADEILVCDDRSTDATIDILEKYAGMHQLQYFVNDVQLGVIANFKKAVSLAKPGNFIALCDQDDEWLPVKLEKSAKLLQKINDSVKPCIVYTDLSLIDAKGSVLTDSFRSIFGYDKYTHTLNTLLYTNFVTGCTVLMNTNAAWWFIEMPASVRSHDEWIALIAFTFGRAQSIDEPLVRYRKHEANVSMPGEVNPQKGFSKIASKILEWIKGDREFLQPQLNVIKQFYGQYRNLMDSSKKQLFESFIKLKNRSFIAKKINYHLMVKANRRTR